MSASENNPQIKTFPQLYKLLRKKWQGHWRPTFEDGKGSGFVVALFPNGRFVPMQEVAPGTWEIADPGNLPGGCEVFAEAQAPTFRIEHRVGHLWLRMEPESKSVHLWGHEGYLTHEVYEVLFVLLYELKNEVRKFDVELSTDLGARFIRRDQDFSEVLPKDFAKEIPLVSAYFRKVYSIQGGYGWSAERLRNRKHNHKLLAKLEAKDANS